MAKFLLYLFALAQIAVAFLPFSRLLVFHGLSGDFFGESSGMPMLVMNEPVVASVFWFAAWLSLALLSFGFARLLGQQARMMKSLEKLPAGDTAARESRAREEKAPDPPKRDRKVHREPPLTDEPPLTGGEDRERPSETPLRSEKPARQEKQRREPTLGTPGSANDER